MNRLGTGLLLLSLSGLASAADPDNHSRWASGAYAGLDVGLAVGSSEQRFPAGAWEGDPAYPAVKADDTSYAVGGQVGVNYLRNNLLIGLEGDIAKTSFKVQAPGVMYPGEGKGEAVGQDVDWFSTVRVRTGAVLGNALLYATGGLAITSGQVTLKDGAYHDSNNQDDLLATGWTAGAGVEYAFGTNLSGKIEYLHLSTSGKASTVCSTAGCFDEGDDGEVFRSKNKFDADIVRVGLNYRF